MYPSPLMIDGTSGLTSALGDKVRQMVRSLGDGTPWVFAGMGMMAVRDLGKYQPIVFVVDREINFSQVDMLLSLSGPVFIIAQRETAALLKKAQGSVGSYFIDATWATAPLKLLSDLPQALSKELTASG